MTTFSKKGAANAPFFRVAELDDAPEILEIYNDAVHTRKSCGHTSEVTLITVIDWLESSRDKRPMWVAELSKEVVAWFAVEDFYGLPAFDRAVEVSVYVSKPHQRKGLATKALTFVSAFLDCISVSHIVACIYGHNTESINLFSKNGYQQWGRLPKIASIDSKQYDLLILGKRI
ncbi:GNAT family N-acetyltransferase [Marinomonas sp. 15G1-11]|uniref:GNAT family N-acetyltransferase n=1 Tax=Marinomonas phaeophyticola TaxID=3004091 RepID=A0ABT4JX38_9GAMM|nr:GNAT family N-acetyltransferase [Marinomonas sp. 15G1-11]MCZ2722884.1 GNAT family N-acetyltransferase [Marinomonas sp. 15G1-11]